MKALENNFLETTMYDIIKEQSRKHLADSLMSNGGSLKFEKECEAIIRKQFESRGFQLEALTIQLTYSGKIMETLDKRLEVNTNVSTLESQIIEQKKRLELKELERQQAMIESSMLTPQILQKMWIEKWDGRLSTTVVGDANRYPFLIQNAK